MVIPFCAGRLRLPRDRFWEALYLAAVARLDALDHPQEPRGQRAGDREIGVRVGAHDPVLDPPRRGRREEKAGTGVRGPLSWRLPNLDGL